MTAPSFDLSRAPWVPCVASDGRAVRLGLEDVLVRAHELRAISHPSPLVMVGLLRTLSALAIRVTGGPTDRVGWSDLWRRGSFDAAAVRAYFDAWRGRFDLFHAEHPFFQIGGLAIVEENGTMKKPDPMARLAAEQASGSNATLFDHGVDDLPSPWTPADAALQLLGTQAMALSGGQGAQSNVFGKHPYAAQAPMVGRLSCWLQGDTLYQTLVLGLFDTTTGHSVPTSEKDVPVWERAGPRAPGKAMPEGYLDYLTFPARYLRIVPSEGRDTLVAEGVYYAPGLQLGEAWAPEQDITVAVLVDPKRGKFPMGLDKSKAVWRDSHALLGASQTTHVPAAIVRRAAGARALLGHDARFRLVCFGMAYKKGTPLLWCQESLPASVRMLDDRELLAVLNQGIRAVEEVHSSLWAALWVFATEYLTNGDDGRSPDREAVSGLTHSLVDRTGFWPALEPAFHTFLDDLEVDPDAALARWTAGALDAAGRGFSTTTRGGLGLGARHHRAAVLGERTLRSKLRNLRRRDDAAPDEVTA